MDIMHGGANGLANGVRPARGCRTLAALLLMGMLGGCAAVTNPVADGVPVRRLPNEVLAPPKNDLVEMPLTFLRQPPPEAYLLDTGDVLGVFIEGVLGEKNQAPPVRFFTETDQSHTYRIPAMGYPIVVGANGTLPLPLVAPLNVRGKTIEEAQEAVRKAYTVDNQILRPGRERILVNLMQPRTYHVLVVREDGGSHQEGQGQNANFGVGYGSNFQIVPGSTHRGSGFTLELPAYKNDVLEALTKTGGLPGLDAKNEVIIQRGGGLDFQPGRAPRAAEIGKGANFVRIPMRIAPGAPPPFKPEDVILHNGDIIYIEARDTDVFYTGGLLFAGQYPLPRDYDIDVVEAIVLVRGAVVNGGVNNINFSGNLVQQGVGFPNPSLVTVLRQTPDCGQVAIHVDLNKALKDPRERVLIRSRDIIILQQTVGEALTGYLTNTVLKFNLFGTLIRQQDLIGTGSATGP